MKVYVVLHDWSSDYEHGLNLLGIFFNEEKAQELFDASKIDELKHAEDNDYMIETDNSYCFDAYEEGYYAKDHTTLTLSEREVDGKISDILLQKAIQCLSDNGIDKDECATVLQALCYILLDVEIEDEDD